MRGAQLYDSIIVRSDKKKKKSNTNKTETGAADVKTMSVSVKMPGEMGGTMSKAMSYDVNPIYSL